MGSFMYSWMYLRPNMVRWTQLYALISDVKLLGYVFLLVCFFFLSNLFFFSSNFLDYAYGIYVLSDFCFARICKWGISRKCCLCDDFSVLTFVVYVCFSRYIHLAWIRLHQDGFILRMDCFYFYIRFDSNSHGWCCQFFFLIFFNGVPGCRQGLTCLWHFFYGFLFLFSFDRLLMLLMESKRGGQTRPVHWGSFLTMVIYVVGSVCLLLLFDIFNCCWNLLLVFSMYCRMWCARLCSMCFSVSAY